MYICIYIIITLLNTSSCPTTVAGVRKQLRSLHTTTTDVTLKASAIVYSSTHPSLNSQQYDEFKK